MGDVVELSAYVFAVPAAYETGRLVEYFGLVPRVGVDFFGKTLEDAISKAATLVKDRVELCGPDLAQNMLDATSLKERIRSANGAAVILRSVEVKFNGHPDYIPCNSGRIVFYEFLKERIGIRKD